MATFIFDFDDTLFDNMSFLKRDVFNIFKDFDLTEEEINKTYQETRRNYSFENHLDKIAETHPNLDKAKILEKLETLAIDKYIIPETEDILEKLKKDHKLLLLSYGNDAFQKKKINGTKLEKHFHEIHITQGDKAEHLKSLNLDHPVYFLNDKHIENERVQGEFPHFKVILVTPENPVSKIMKEIE